MNNTTGFLRKRWLDFRNGHSVYLAFGMSFMNFILISYNFAIKESTFLQAIFTNLMIFTLLFIGGYIPLAIILGYWHRRKQYVVDNEAMIQENWIGAWQTRYVIRLIKGLTTKKEDEDMLEFLDKILTIHKKKELMNYGAEYN